MPSVQAVTQGKKRLPVQPSCIVSAAAASPLNCLLQADPCLTCLRPCVHELLGAVILEAWYKQAFSTGHQA